MSGMINYYVGKVWIWNRFVDYASKKVCKIIRLKGLVGLDSGIETSL